MLRVAGAVARPCKQTDMSLAEFWDELERSNLYLCKSAAGQGGSALPIMQAREHAAGLASELVFSSWILAQQPFNLRPGQA